MLKAQRKLRNEKSCEWKAKEEDFKKARGPLLFSSSLLFSFDSDHFPSPDLLHYKMLLFRSDLSVQEKERRERMGERTWACVNSRLLARWHFHAVFERRTAVFTVDIAQEESFERYRVIAVVVESCRLCL